MAMPAAASSERPDYDLCIRCGLCLNSCPTFRLLGDEMDSPRGRIYQMALAARAPASMPDQAQLPMDSEFQLHMDRCLDCRACVTACPSGVPYGQMIERTRATLQAHRPMPPLRRWLLERVVPNRRRLAWAATAVRLYQRSGAQTLARASGFLEWMGLAAAERMCPSLPPAPPAPAPEFYPAEGTPRARVVLLPGCVQAALMPELNAATLRVLRRQGCEVLVPAALGCCGALQVHAGLRERARELARHNIIALESIPADALITNAAGCGATLKEYAELFAGEPEWQQRAAAFASRVEDVTEFLDRIGLRRALLGPLPAVVTYQDACHLAHGQGIRQAPRTLLRAIPGLTLRELERADQCCGSAGIYNLVQPEIARALLADRVAAITRSGAEIVATANPGCSLQLRSGVPGRSVALGPAPVIDVLHVIELLDLSHRALR